MGEAVLIVQIVTAVIYAATLITTIVIAFRQNKKADEIAMKQSRNDFFAEYTRRYQDIILHMPDEVFEGTAKVDGATLKYMQLYYDLCSEEFHLHENGLVPDDVWDNWKEGMEITTHIELYKKSWDRLKGNYTPDFYHFMERDVLKLRNE